MADEVLEKAGGYVSKLVFNNGESIDVKQDDIVLFVGPNNVGKSQSLKDLYELSKGKRPTTVVSEISIIKYSGSVTNLLETISTGQFQSNYTSYPVLGGNLTVNQYTEKNYLKDGYYDDFRLVFVANLDTSARLSICQPRPNILRDEPKQHPIHYAAFNAEYRKWLAKNFKKAFNKDVIPNTQFGGKIPLCMGDPIKLTGEYEDEQTRLEAYAQILGGYPQVQDQGDGIKSFTGILLYLMLDYYCTYLIDEPESFLHPPQARIMGQIIGETLSDRQQAFISTHSEEIIKGLMETCPERLKIIRITRDGNTNHFSILNNEKFDEIWGDPLLKHSNIMSSLFHKTVVLCESDADCQMYSIIENHIKQKQGKYSEALFIHCGGKHRMAKVITALKSLNVDVRVVPDIDAMNDEGVFTGIVEACGMEWSNISKDYRIIVSNLHSTKEVINRSSARTIILQILDNRSDTNLSKSEIDQIKNTVETVSKWDNIKKMGIPAIPAGDATSAFRCLDAALKSAGIHLVPVGELECFIKEAGGHGPAWVNNVLEEFPDLDNAVYSKITEFVAGLNL